MFIYPQYYLKHISSTDLHALELRGEFRTGKFELLNDVGDFLKAMSVAVRPLLTVRHHQERRAFK